MKITAPILSLLILLVGIPGCARDLGGVKADPNQDSAGGLSGRDGGEHPTSIDAQELMNQVAKRYSSLTYYSCRGTNVHNSNFDGKEDEAVRTEFEMEYNRGHSGSIEWMDGGTQKKFFFDGKTASLSEYGRVVQTYSSPLDGLMTVELAAGGWTLFEINLFVFRDELKLGNVFFRTTRDATVSDDCEVDGHRCYLLSGPFKNHVDGSMSYWIDKEDFLVRKIERVIIVGKQSPEKRYVRTTTTTEQYSDIKIR